MIHIPAMSLMPPATVQRAENRSLPQNFMGKDKGASQGTVPPSVADQLKHYDIGVKVDAVA